MAAVSISPRWATLEALLVLSKGGNSEEAIARVQSLSPLGYLYGGGLVLAVGRNDRAEAMLNTSLSRFTVPLSMTTCVDKNKELRGGGVPGHCCL